MAKLSTDQLIDAFKELTLIELSEFVSQFEEVFNVTAAAPVAMAAAPAAGGGDACARGEVQTVVTISFGCDSHSRDGDSRPSRGHRCGGPPNVCVKKIKTKAFRFGPLRTDN